MLDWFNALIQLFKEFFEMLLDLPFYGSASIGFILIAAAITGVTLEIFFHRVK